MIQVIQVRPYVARILYRDGDGGIVHIEAANIAQASQLAAAWINDNPDALLVRSICTIGPPVAYLRPAVDSGPDRLENRRKD